LTTQAVELRALATDDDWAAYHAIRRRVLFELRGIGARYDANHPDEHRPDHYPFLLWVGDAAAGVIRIDVAGAVATFRRVAIRDDLQRRGLGRRLLNAAERFAREHGCARVEANVDAGAIAFYERCGYRRTDRPSAGDATFMTKDLTPP
jgi:GNAT superfamily N-acetyltransferase